MVVLQRLTETCALGEGAKAFFFFFFSAFCRGPFVLVSGVPGPQRPLPRLCSLHLQYAANKYSSNAMNASLSVSVNVPK